MKMLGLALVGLTLSGCATPDGVQDRLASRMYLVGHDVGPEERESRVVQALELPLAGELYLFPRWLQIHAPEPTSGEPIRLQTALRIVREDGSISHWWLGSERSAPAGEGGRSIAPESFAAGSTTLSFGTVRLGPLRLEGVIGVEVLVAELSGPTDSARTRLTGAAVLARAPLVGSSDAEALQHAAEVKGGGAAAEARSDHLRRGTVDLRCVSRGALRAGFDQQQTNVFR